MNCNEYYKEPKMIEIHPADLEEGKTYYMEFPQTFELERWNFKNPSPNIVRKIQFNIKNRADRKYKVFITGTYDEYDIRYTVDFRRYESLNSTKREVWKKFWSGTFMYNDHKAGPKYYLPRRDFLVKKRETDTINAVLQNIIGDPTFKFV